MTGCLFQRFIKQAYPCVLLPMQFPSKPSNKYTVFNKNTTQYVAIELKFII